jgi:hypothetical protein
LIDKTFEGSAPTFDGLLPHGTLAEATVTEAGMLAFYSQLGSELPEIDAALELLLPRLGTAKNIRAFHDIYDAAHNPKVIGALAELEQFGIEQFNSGA